MDTTIKENNPDKWKNKYYDLIEENETLENASKAKEELLCKTIKRLSHVATGFNESLDPYLQNIKEQVSKDINIEQLQPELAKFSKAVMALEEIKTVSEDVGIFDTETLRNNLHNILDQSEIPIKFEPEVQELKKKLYSNISPAIILKETVSLLFEIKKHLQSEQQEIASFLTQVTDQLADIGVKVSGAYSITKASEKKRNLFDQTVSSQFIELQEYSESATELEPLKNLIHSRLDIISQQIQNHQTQEQLERSQGQQELEVLSNKIKKMEEESLQLKDKLIIAHKKAIHDSLTGLPNRLAYDNQLATEIARWRRYQTPLSLLIWDIDYFKKINDTYGHKAGDKTLILIANLLSEHCRATDFVSRFGGEEFTMLLSNTDAKSALLAANKIREVMEKTAFNSNGAKLSITLSCGVTQFTESDTEKSAFERADKALYEAKNKGRNQCLVG